MYSELLFNQLVNIQLLFSLLLIILFIKQTTSAAYQPRKEKMNTSNKRPERVKRFQAIDLVEPQNYGDHVNAVGMVFSLVGLIMRVSSCDHK